MLAVGERFTIELFLGICGFKYNHLPNTKDGYGEKKKNMYICLQSPAKDDVTCRNQKPFPKLALDKADGAKPFPDFVSSAIVYEL